MADSAEITPHSPQDMTGNRDPESERPTVAQRYGESARNLGGVMMIPTMLLVGPALGYFGGSWLEGKFGYAPWLSMLGVVLGAAAGMRQIIKIVRQSTTAERDRKHEK